MNWIYRQIYRLSLRTPSKHSADETAALFVGLFAAMHIEFITFFVLRSANVRIPPSIIKASIIAGFLVCMGVAFYHYVYRKKGTLIMKGADTSLGIVNLVVSVALVLETFFLPIWASVLFLSRK
jgi:hypothetical protein